MKSVSEFYDSVAPEYDRMTDFEKRFEQEEDSFRKLVSEYNIGTALDAGCGTGFSSLLLASLGVRVTAVDISREMLQRLGRHAREHRLTIHTIEASFEQLPAMMKTGVDAVFCLGNTLSHMLTGETLARTLANFKQLLNSNGVLVIQVLNYDRILRNRERIQSVKERGDKTYIRFYDFLNETVAFNILTLERKEDRVFHSLRTTELRPVLHEELVRFLMQAGFHDCNSYGSLALSPYDSESSNDLIICAR